MTQIQTALERVNTIEKYTDKMGMMQWMYNTVTHRSVSRKDLAAISGFLASESKKLLELIPAAMPYREKDNMIYFADTFVPMLEFLTQKSVNILPDMPVYKALALMVTDQRVPGTAIDKMFEFDTIERSDVLNVLEVVKPLTDEFQRSVFIQGLAHFKDKITKMTEGAKAEISDYIAADFDRILKNKACLTQDQINALEMLADACKHFMSDKSFAALNECMRLPYDNIRYHAMETLLISKQIPSANVVVEMANDLEYAELTYGLLKKFHQTHLFPKEFATPEYLAKSDLVHWLVYPTELGKMPDEIELLGTIKSHRELYYVFKFMTDSDNMDAECQRVWLVGWSNDNGGTFSNFDKLSDYQQKDLKKTLKVIKKRLIG